MLLWRPRRRTSRIVNAHKTAPIKAKPWPQVMGPDDSCGQRMTVVPMKAAPIKIQAALVVFSPVIQFEKSAVNAG